MSFWLMVIMAAEVAGPPSPSTQKTTPAQAAIALYHQDHDPPPLPKPCKAAGQDETVVCGNPGDRSPDRLPLPDESGPRAGARRATGEMPSTVGGVGGSPALQGKGAGLTLKIPFGQGTAPAKPAVTGNADD